MPRPDGVRLHHRGEQIYEVHAPVGTVIATYDGWTSRAPDGQTFHARHRDNAVTALVLYAVRRSRAETDRHYPEDDDA
ncbi:hypothetical protein [Frankia sp. AgB32]|uniref:hypothetical protein n=1 Tax=Frankia sp. AgB32 TaxID=631119 RepID=UPI00200EFEAE|nr:hypothetical protein [Frankia sp. AgB32]MCK9897664.1 hypothetical protein [Frankia sp. AgB32]